MFGTGLFAPIYQRLTFRWSSADGPEALLAPPAMVQIKMDERHRTAIRAAIAEVYERFANRVLRTNDLVPWPTGADSVRQWMTDAYASDRIPEDDAVVFSGFRREMGTILDVGAHWGYTALSIRRFGCDCPIISFEASNSHAECLDEFRKLDGNYDFLLCALGDDDARHSIYCPAVNGQVITGLNCVEGTVFNAHHREYIVSLIGLWVAPADTYRFQLAKTSHITRRLDDLFATTQFRVPAKRIAAIKLDVEGFEAPVLRGAAAILKRDLPFIMIEGANRHPEVCSILQSLGYLYADRSGSKLRLTEVQSSAVNGYWLHPRHMDRYAAMGLVLQPAEVAA